MRMITDRNSPATLLAGGAPLRAALWLVVTVVLAGAAVVIGGVAQPTASRAAAADEEASAIAEAQRTGQRVEVTAKTTESEQVFANPDGTLTFEASAVPVRARKGGTWAPIDTTLERRADGSLAPRTTTVAIAFSGGGMEAPLARIAKSGWSLALTWPAALPVPTLAADTATYPEVFPGVDLVLRATPDGLSEVLVVKTAQAAANPALRKIKFGVRAKGVSLEVNSGGGLTAVDQHGLPVFLSPKPSMWDSGADAGSRDSAQPAHNPVRGPREGDQVTPIGLELTETAVSVLPDASMLAGAHTRFPVFIDPTASPTKNAWAMVNQRYPNTAYYKWSGDSENAEGMGYITDSYDGWHRKRLGFRFPTRTLNGKHILGATFKAYETHTYSCTTSNVELWLLSGLPSDTTWNDQPSWQRKLDTRRVAYGRSGCDENGAWVAFSATSGVREATSSGMNNTHLGLRAGDESWANYSWKRFRNDAVLSIDYNTAPAKPTSPRTTSPETTCVVSDDPPAIPNDPPMLVARLNDADGAKGQKVMGRFYLYQKGGSLISKHDTAYKLPGADYTVQLPELSDGSYSWRLRAYDGVDWGPYSDWCDFRVDSSRPATPTISTPDGQTYRHYQDATFAFGPGGSADVSKYRYSFMSDGATSGEVPADSSTITEPMRFFGPNKLRVWSYDAAGNVSDPPGSLEFTVAGDFPRTQWRLDEGNGTTTADAIYSDTLTLSGGCDWTTGRWHADDPSDAALSFTGTNGEAARERGLLWMNQNFSVTAWVRVADASTKRVAVSQRRHPTSGFTLGVQPDPDTGAPLFAFMHSNPDTSSTVIEATAMAPAIVDGEWIHLAAVYRAPTRELTLFVGGEYAASVNAEFTGVEATGPFVIGRGFDDGAPSHFWSGDIDEVRTFNGSLDDDQVWWIANEPRPAP